MNQAMLAKACWRMVQKDEGLWCRIYNQKYLVHSSIIQNYKKPVSCSSTWASISSGAELLRKGLKWRLGNGKGVNFWRDRWSDWGELIEHAVCRPENLNENVCDYWKEQVWDVEKLAEVLPWDIINSICAIPIGEDDIEDRIIWGPTSNGSFSVKSAYLLNFTDDCQSCSPWVQIWKLCIPPKIKLFLWTMVAGKVLTNMQRAVRHFTMDSSCPHCPGEPESLLHLFRDCAKAKEIWNAFNIPANMKASFVLCWKDWLFANLMQCRCMIFNMPWNTFFAFMVWHIWKWRCKCIFDNNFNMPFDAKGIICACMEEWKKANEKLQCRMSREEVSLGWQRPASGILKLNVDGARSNDGAISAGGVLRNCEGGWQCGFMAALGEGEVLQAEAWAMFHGLRMAAEAGTDRLEVESDSSVLVSLLQDGWVDVHPLGTLLQNCSRIMQRFRFCSLKHIYREANCTADVLAKASLGGNFGCQIFSDAPHFVLDVLLSDAAGMRRRRVVKAKLQPGGSGDTACSSNAA